MPFVFLKKELGGNACFCFDGREEMHHVAGCIDLTPFHILNSIQKEKPSSKRDSTTNETVMDEKDGG